jgi:ferredoxin
MKTVIYYFTGTGNSLAIAKDLANELDGDILSIAGLADKEKISTDADVIGIVYPVYALGIPRIVARFIKKLDLRKDQYVFTVANYAMVQGAGLTAARRLLKRNGIIPKAGFGIVMPNNYTPFGEAIPEERQKGLFRAAKDKVKNIAKIVRDGRAVPPETGFFLARWLLGEPMAVLSAIVTPREDKNFRLNEKCNGCGICAKLCPVGNIEMSGDRPGWKHRCELCFACFQLCPQEAIEFGKNTRGKKRYHHPEMNRDTGRFS